MKRRHIALIIFATIFILIPSTNTTRAQQVQPRGIQREDSAIARRQRAEDAFEEQVFQMRLLERNARARPPATDPRVVAMADRQLRDNFRQLQISNNEIVVATFPATTRTPPALDHRLIARSAREINRRASWLRTNLRLPERDPQEPLPTSQEAADTAQLRRSLIVLNSLIRNFITNPMFRNMRTLDVQDSTQARRDLERIIELSRAVKQSAERLRR